jgi:tRNA-dihydrouridine synthase B
LIDINMGCPVKKVVQSGSGSALLKNLPLAREIIQAVVSKAACPVTVKFRLGWDQNNLNYLELGKLCEDEGVAAVTLHARTRAQAYTGRADWTGIAQLKQALKIPVIGNGDVKTRSDFQRMLTETGCDGVMIGRALMGNPWLIESIVQDKEIIPNPAERIQAYLKHTRQCLQKFPQRKPEQLVCEMRKFAHRYINGFPGAVQLRQEINQIKDYSKLETLFKSFM